MRPRGGILSASVTALAALALAAPARADFGIASWQAGTCKTDVPECTYSSPEGQFFTQAAGHPPVGLTDFEVNTGGVLGTPEGTVKDVRVDLPVGLNVDPQAVPQCPKDQFESNPALCAASLVGTSTVKSISSVLTVPLTIPVYNLVPDPGEPALFGFNVSIPLVVNANIYLRADVAWDGDYHEGFTISEVPSSVPLVENRLVFDGTKGGSFLTVPSPCHGDTATGLKVDSYENPGTFLSYSATPALPVREVPIDGCQSVPFQPGVGAEAAGAPADSPAAVSVETTVPQRLQPVNSSTLRTAHVTLPRGLGLNPSAAPGLQSCSDAQLGKGTRNPVACPAASQVGTVAIETPVLPAHSLTGKVFLGQQLSRDPTSGQEYRIFVDAESARYGVSVRLVGNVSADPATGQLTATFADAPQVAFSSFRLQFDGGDRAPLSSPPTCGPNTTNASIDPWSGNPPATPSGTFTLTSAPGGGACAKTMAERPFAPGFSAQPGSSAAKKYTPFSVRIARGDGQQELKGVDLTLPAGATAKLKGVPYCKPGEIAAAEHSSGAAEKANPNCPDASGIGVASVLAGTGPSPLKIEGTAYLAGPYAGAPLSIVVSTPALAGPFDLGTVVVRVPIFVNPETARVNPRTNAIPDVYGGTKLDVRSIFVNVNRKQFTLNGSNCRKGATAGNLLGGGADPTNPASFSAFAVSAPFRAVKCRKFKFKPRLKLRLFGATRRAQHPRLRAALLAKPGNSNIGRASVALPHALFLDQASLATICTRVQFAAGECPKRSVYGKARAFSPLLGKPLEGPVYLRSSNHTLPDLVAHLKGQVTIDLVGRIDSFQGGIRTTFDHVPDVPVKKFVMTLPGGKHGLLVASTNLCRKPVKGIVQLKAQNGRKANRHVTLRTPCS
jgi:hypothetical protein